MTASVTIGRALRYTEGSARGLIHQLLGHDPELSLPPDEQTWARIEHLAPDDAAQPDLYRSWAARSAKNA